MRFALRAHSTSEDGGAELAVVSLDAKAREQMLKRRAVFAGIKAYDSDLAYLEFWDYSPDWYEHPHFDDEWMGETADNEVVPDFTAVVEGEPLCAECVRVTVNEEGIHWCCWIKHTNIRCDTVTIPWALLED